MKRSTLPCCQYVWKRVTPKTAWCLVLLLLIAASVRAQDKPDFSGHWVLENPQEFTSDIARALTVRQSIEGSTARGTPMEPFFSDLTVEREFSTGARSESYQIGVVGGVVGGVDRAGPGAGPDGHSPQTRFAVRWDGNRLVIETGTYSGPTRESGPYTEHTEAWSLDAQSRLVITLTDRRSGGESATRTLTYRRR